MIKTKIRYGKEILIRDAEKYDASELLRHIQKLADERIYLLMEPEEIPKTIEEEERFIEIYRKKNRRLLVALLDGKIVGSADCRIGGFRKNRHTASFGVAVRKEYRGAGIGTALMKELMKWAENKGAKKLWLSVFSTNGRAIALYEKLGFQVECVRKGQFNVNVKYVDEIIMVKWVISL